MRGLPIHEDEDPAGVQPDRDFNPGNLIFNLKTINGTSADGCAEYTLPGNMGVVRNRLDPKDPKRGKTDWARVEALTEAEIRRAARSDPDAPLLSKKELKELERIPDVRAIRKRLGITQAEFAKRFRLSVGTVRDWEQGRFEPDQASRTLLRLIERIPKQVEHALEAR